MHLKVFLKLISGCTRSILETDKTLKTLSSAQNYQKITKKTKKITKNTGLGFLKNRVFSNNTPHPHFTPNVM
jgi:hypothetical protein